MISRLFLSAAFAALPLLAMAQRADFNVIPVPQEVRSLTNSDFTITPQTVIEFPMGNDEVRANALYLAGYIKETTGIELKLRPALIPGVKTGGRVMQRPGELPKNVIRLQLGHKSGNPEAYGIQVSQRMVEISSSTAAGGFYGVQTLRKALPVVESRDAKEVVVPGVEVNDAPRFAYRGAHFDTSRHYFTPDSVKRFIDMLALHNINRFHWHITDDQGWRIEIKKYPRLTEVGSKRKETVIGHNTGRYDGKPYGGFYTQDEVRDIVAYAAARHITVVPEIDMPGHMLGALAAYPELGCTGGPYEVWTMWGVSEEVLCAGNDKVLQFISDVLDEVVQLFPSEYIHVGGDECPKTRWKSCPKCQARIAKEGLQADGKHSAEERLQSFVIRHAEKHLSSLGRKMIGWDETLEGGLAPGATVMSWRGEGGGIQAARMGHDVIMTPNTYLYFDYYQTKDRASEPEAIGGYVPVSLVYNYEPMPAALTPEQQKHIVGVQANCWTEYMPNFRQVEYMELPRMAALSEVQWSNPAKKDYGNFLQRLPRLIAHYDLANYNYATHVYEPTATYTPDPAARAIRVSVETIDNAPIHYTLDGKEPTENSKRYTAPVLVKKPLTFKAAAFRRKVGKSRTIGETFTFNLATGRPVTLLQPVNKQYAYGGAPTLVDGIHGADTNYKTGRWIAFYTNDLEAVIDLGKATRVGSVSLRTCVEKGDWVFDARGLEVSVSHDGKNFTTVAKEDYPALTQKDRNGIYTHALTFGKVKARYVKVRALSERSIPAWHGGKGRPAFLFVDEIEVK